MEPFQFDMPKNKNSVIKVIGVGGGGNNAVNYMYDQGIEGVDFVICNTDAQALNNSPVPNKLQLGAAITEGLGAGANPEIGEQAALESKEEIKALIENNTKLIFITAGMGGGTGTGAAPVIAAIAKEMGILTVAIVTVPFQFEGKSRLESAEAGINKLRQEVDSLIVINNNKLRDLYGDLGYKSGFSKADEVLATAAKGIAEVITQNYIINIDLKDAKTVLQNSGTAIMGSHRARGENRAKEAVAGALDSPLLNDNRVTGAKNVLLLIVSGNDEVTIDEIGVISDFIQSETGNNANIIMGVGEDPDLDDSISVTIVATGFPIEDQEQYVVSTSQKKVYHTLKDDQPVSKTLYDKGTAEESMPYVGNTFNNVTKYELDLEEEDEVKSNPSIQKDWNDHSDIDEIEFEVRSLNDVSTKNLESLEEKVLSFELENEVEMESEFQEPMIEQTTIFSLADFEEAEEDFSPQEKKMETMKMEETVEEIEMIAEPNKELLKKIQERRERLMQFNAKYDHLSKNVDEVEKTPAYKRQGIELDESQNRKSSMFYLDNEEDEIQLRPNQFFDDNVD